MRESPTAQASQAPNAPTTLEKLIGFPIQPAEMRRSSVRLIGWSFGCVAVGAVPRRSFCASCLKPLRAGSAVVMSAEPSPAISRVILRPIASPLPLGLLALTVGTFTIAAVQLSWIPAAQSPQAGLTVLTFVVPLQVVSFIFGFLARDPAASTGMGLQAGGWFSIGLATYTGRPGQASPALGLVLVGAATVLLVPAVTASLSKVLAGVVMALTSVRFYLTGAYELSSAPGWKEAAGLAGLVLAVVALYAGLAFELEDSRRATLLPTLRRGAGRRALTGDLPDEVARVHHEAGVRQKL
jgi:uncharacterized protein